MSILSSLSDAVTSTSRQSVHAAGMSDRLPFGRMTSTSIAYAMLLIVVTGPFLAWPRFRNTLLGWHLSAGWVLLPLVLLPPATAVLMTLHVGHPVYLPPSPRPISLARGIERAAAAADLSGFETARSFRQRREPSG